MLEQLDAANLNITVAYWHYDENHEEWRLVFASPQVPEVGSLPPTQVIQKTLDQMSNEEKEGLTLREIGVISPRWPEVVNLRKRYGMVNAVRERQTIRRISLDKSEPFIYRLN